MANTAVAVLRKPQMGSQRVIQNWKWPRNNNRIWSANNLVKGMHSGLGGIQKTLLALSISFLSHSASLSSAALRWCDKCPMERPCSKGKGNRPVPRGDQIDPPPIGPFWLFPFHFKHRKWNFWSGSEWQVTGIWKAHSRPSLDVLQRWFLAVPLTAKPSRRIYPVLTHLWTRTSQISAM